MKQNIILQYLNERSSSPLLTDPGPSKEELNSMVQAALRVPDHALLSPWRVIAVHGDQRKRLGELWSHYLAGTRAEAEKLTHKAMRAPLILICMACIQNHSKVPAQEQCITAGLATYSILMAANSLGYDGYWRTGQAAYDQGVQQALGLKANEEIVGYLYLGTSAYKKTRASTATVQEKLSFLKSM